MRSKRSFDRCFPLALVFFAADAVLVPGRSFAGELLFSQYADGQSTYGPSQLWPDAGVNSEAADDFDVIGSIDRVVASGFIWGVTPQWRGVYVRFYQYGGNGAPGALLREEF